MDGKQLSQKTRRACCRVGTGKTGRGRYATVPFPRGVPPPGTLPPRSGCDPTFVAASLAG